MTWSEWWPIVAAWIPAVSTSTALLIIGAIVGPVYKSRIERSIQFKFDAKLELLRSQLRRDEEDIKSEFKLRDEQIAALRNGALSSLAARQVSADKRRLQAVENVWCCIINAGFLKTLVIFTSVLKMDKVMESASSHTSDGENMKLFLDQMWTSHKLERVENLDWADKDRPFVSTSAWIKFTVYKQVLLYPYALISLARVGAGTEAISGPEKLIESICTILPHQRSYLEKHGTIGLYSILEEIEQTLLSELIADIDGEKADVKTIQQAAAILSAAAAASQPRPIEGMSIEVPNSLKRQSV